jgi:putative ABC transport system substrate-binding protein
MRRRDFITLVGGVAAWPLGARAQQPAMPVIGFLNSRGNGEDPQLLTAFRKGLKEAGFVEGQNVVIDYRFADNHDDRLPALAVELVRRRVAVIFANGPAVVPAKAASTSIPVVFAIGFDPVQFGLVASLNRPGGNLTGVVNLFDEIGPKRLELVHELVPAATSIAVLLNPSYSSKKCKRDACLPKAVSAQGPYGANRELPLWAPSAFEPCPCGSRKCAASL